MLRNRSNEPKERFLRILHRLLLKCEPKWKKLWPQELKLTDFFSLHKNTLQLGTLYREFLCLCKCYCSPVSDVTLFRYHYNNAMCIIEWPSKLRINNSVKPHRVQYILRHFYYTTMQKLCNCEALYRPEIQCKCHKGSPQKK